MLEGGRSSLASHLICCLLMSLVSLPCSGEIFFLFQILTGQLLESVLSATRTFSSTEVNLSHMNSTQTRPVPALAIIKCGASVTCTCVQLHCIIIIITIPYELNTNQTNAIIKCGGNVTCTCVQLHYYYYILEKWFPLRGERAHSLKLFCMYDKRFEI